MARNKKTLVPEARNALDNMKHEVANEIGVKFKEGYNGDMTSRDAGRVGGQMVKKLIDQAEKQMQGR